MYQEISSESLTTSGGGVISGGQESEETVPIQPSTAIGSSPEPPEESLPVLVENITCISKETSGASVVNGGSDSLVPPSDTVDEITAYLEKAKHAAEAKGDEEEISRVVRLITEHRRLLKEGTSGV